MQIQIDVPDIHCSNCAKKIKLALGYTAGVESANYNLQEKQVIVNIDNLKISSYKLKAIIIALGFSAILI